MKNVLVGWLMLSFVAVSSSAFGQDEVTDYEGGGAKPSPKSQSVPAEVEAPAPKAVEVPAKSPVEAAPTPKEAEVSKPKYRGVIDGASINYEGDKNIPDAFRLRKKFDKPRSRFWPVLGSFFLPGLDQWIEGQHPYGPMYTGVSVLGNLYAAANLETDASTEEQEGYRQPNEKERRVMWGSQIYQTAGSISAYHAFRTAMWSRKQLMGKYNFVSKQESIYDVVMSPFQFQYLTQPGVFVPLLIGGGLYFLQMELAKEDENIKIDGLGGSDLFYTGAISYNAGVGEEAMFRGWLLPEFREMTGSDFWSNAITTTIFAAAHLNTVSIPIPQFALGWYLGVRAQRDGYSISKAAFIHTWWDVLAFLAVYQITQEDNKTAEIKKPLPAFRFPGFEYSF